MSLRNQRGQFVLEGILLMVVMLACIAAVMAFFNKNNVLGDLVRGPWQALAGLLENGHWSPPQKGQIYHPNQHARHVTIIGVKP